MSIEISKYALKLTRNDAHNFALLHLPEILKTFGNADISRDLKESITRLYESQRDKSLTSGDGSTAAFDQEIRRRQFALYFYLVRSPLFDRCLFFFSFLYFSLIPSAELLSQL